MQKLILLLFTICSVINAIGVKLENSTVNLNTIRYNLKKYIADLQIDSLTETPLNDIYQVVSGHKIFYTDRNAKYIILGNIIDLNTKQSLTEEAMSKIATIDFSLIPLNLGIKEIKGNGKASLVVFSDPECPFCKQLELYTLSKINNVTIYYFLYPLNIHPSAKDNSLKILCSENPSKTYIAYMTQNIALPFNDQCKNIDQLDQMIKVGDQIVGVSKTPTMVLTNGTILTGIVPAKYLSELLESAPTSK